MPVIRRKPRLTANHGVIFASAIQNQFHATRKRDTSRKQYRRLLWGPRLGFVVRLRFATAMLGMRFPIENLSPRRSTTRLISRPAWKRGRAAFSSLLVGGLGVDALCGL